jgi:hypothetical protein
MAVGLYAEYRLFDMRRRIAELLYYVANMCCVAADKLWDEDGFWEREYERLYHAE